MHTDPSTATLKVTRGDKKKPQSKMSLRDLLVTLMKEALSSWYPFRLEVVSTSLLQLDRFGKLKSSTNSLGFKAATFGACSRVPQTLFKFLHLYN
jgi:hypothetical protein